MLGRSSRLQRVASSLQTRSDEPPMAGSGLTKTATLTTCFGYLAGEGGPEALQLGERPLRHRRQLGGKLRREGVRDDAAGSRTRTPWATTSVRHLLRHAFGPRHWHSQRCCKMASGRARACLAGQKGRRVHARQCTRANGTSCTCAAARRIWRRTRRSLPPSGTGRCPPRPRPRRAAAAATPAGTVHGGARRGRVGVGEILQVRLGAHWHWAAMHVGERKAWANITPSH